MNTPAIVQASLVTILKVGLLIIRSEAERENSKRCAIETNHLHNIPGLLDNFSVDALKYYIDVEAPQYVRESNEQIPEEFRRAWAELTDWLSQQ